MWEWEVQRCGTPAVRRRRVHVAVVAARARSAQRAAGGAQQALNRLAVARMMWAFAAHSSRRCVFPVVAALRC